MRICRVPVPTRAAEEGLEVGCRDRRIDGVGDACNEFGCPVRCWVHDGLFCFFGNSVDMPCFCFWVTFGALQAGLALAGLYKSWCGASPDSTSDFSLEGWLHLRLRVYYIASVVERSCLAEQK